MPRWPVILLGVALYWSAPWVIATLFLLGGCMVWFGFNNTYRHAIPLLLIFGALAYIAFGRDAHAYSVKCTGLCSGTISQKSYLPRTKYVRPYIRKGRYVQPYTRSK